MPVAPALVTGTASAAPAAPPVRCGVEQLHVGPRAQRHGHGGVLLGHAQALHGASSLWTFAANAGARAFSTTHGFTVDGPPSSDDEGRPALRDRWVRADAARA